MSITAKDAIKAAREKIGTPYGSGRGEMDCINLIKHVIRTAPGGAKDYTTAGTNTLWRSIASAKKYRDLTYRQATIDEPEAGMLAFKASGEDVHHVGLVTGEGTVIHASSARGEVVETVLSEGEGWNALAIHRYIQAGAGVEPEPDAEKPGENEPGAYVVSAGGGLRQRTVPGGRYMQMIPDGTRIEIDRVTYWGGQPWGHVKYRRHEGWVSMYYVWPAENEEETND